MIVCSCNERMEEEELAADREAGCPPLEANIRRLAAKRKRPWQPEARCAGYDVSWFALDRSSRQPPDLDRAPRSTGSGSVASPTE